MGFNNDSQYYRVDFYSENQSVQPNIDRLFGYRREVNCSLGSEYESFAYDGDSLEMAYQQPGTVAFFTCFKEVRLNSDGSVILVRNDLECDQFREPQPAVLRVYDFSTLDIVAQVEVEQFSLDVTTYAVGVTTAINENTMTLQVLTADEELLDEVRFVVLLAPQFDVLRYYLVAIIPSVAIQIIATGLFVGMRQRVIASIQGRKQRKAQKQRSRMDTLDL